MVTLVQLELQGWHLKADALAELEEEEECTEQELLARIQDIDLKKVGAPSLPEDVNRMAAGVVKGPLVLQLQGVRDITRSTTSLAVGGPRMLLLQLTDGKLTCKASEHKRVDALSDLMLPGTKLQLTNVPVKMGVLLLESKAVKVLGGRVEDLAADFEFQQKFAGVERAKGGQQDDTAPPPFRHFIPGRDNLKGLPRGNKATTPSAGVAAQSAAAGGGPAGAAPSITQATLMAAAHALPGAKAASSDQAGSISKRAVDVAPAQVPVGAQSAQAGAKLLQVMASEEGRGGRRGGRGGERGGRWGRRRGRDDYNDGADDGMMTMEEYEAKQKAKLAAMLGKPAVQPSQQGTSSGQQQVQDDEALARALQAQLDMEDQVAQAQATVQENIAGASGSQHGRGRGRETQAGRGRGGRQDNQRPHSATPQIQQQQQQHCSVQSQDISHHQQQAAGYAPRPTSAMHSEQRAQPIGYQRDASRTQPIASQQGTSMSTQAQGTSIGSQPQGYTGPAAYNGPGSRGRGRGGRDGLGGGGSRGPGRGRGGFDRSVEQPAVHQSGATVNASKQQHQQQHQQQQQQQQHQQQQQQQQHQQQQHQQQQGRHAEHRQGGTAAAARNVHSAPSATRPEAAQQQQQSGLRHTSGRPSQSSHSTTHTSAQPPPAVVHPGPAPQTTNSRGQSARSAADGRTANAGIAATATQGELARPPSAVRTQPAHAPGAARVAMRAVAAALGGMPGKGATRSVSGTLGQTQ